MLNTPIRKFYSKVLLSLPAVVLCWYWSKCRGIRSREAVHRTARSVAPRRFRPCPNQSPLHLDPE